jgi:hypothetical protein
MEAAHVSQRCHLLERDTLVQARADSLDDPLHCLSMDLDGLGTLGFVTFCAEHRIPASVRMMLTVEDGFTHNKLG